ncbi:MAG TPA: outer membrane lipoprotein carrier protein LolA [Syntrophorhabdaceae bacterium]|nr:outer membrane lipoprotein carrier protein LolA [Syntrophorhabdaceae bacterium]
MGKRWENVLCVSALIVAVTTSSFAVGFDDLKKTYGDINSLEATFHQKIFIATIKRAREFDGEFFYKRGKGFLWRYTKPKIKYFLYDGRYMWQDEEDKTFVLKEKINKERTGGTFFDLVEDITKLDDLFVLKQESVAGDMRVLDLVPRKEGSITRARVWIDKENIVRKIEMEEFTGNINTIEFSPVKVNAPIGDAKFIYRPDKNKEVVEH